MVGENIKAARKAKKLTLDQLAEKMGSSSGTLSHIENGSRSPSLEMLNKIADTLGIPSSDLLAGDSLAESNYFSEVDKYTNPDKDSFLASELNSAIDNESLTGSPLKIAAEVFKIDPELFVTMCRAKDLPEEDRKMLRDMSAKLLEMHHSRKKDNDK